MVLKLCAKLNFSNFSMIGGFEFNATQCVRIAEVTGNDLAVDVTLGAHQSMGLKVIFAHFLLALVILYQCLAD